MSNKQNIPVANDGRRRNPNALTPRQVRFVREFVETMNGAEAARRAGYAKKYAGIYASDLLKQSHIRQAIDDLVAERASVTRSMLIEELTAVALSNADDLFSWCKGEELREVLDDGTVVIREVAKVHLRPSSELTRRQKAAIKSIVEKTGSDGRRSVELQTHDKLRAVELLGRALGLFGNGETTINLNAPVASVTVSYADDPQIIEGSAREVVDNDDR